MLIYAACLALWALTVSPILTVLIYHFRMTGENGTLDTARFVQEISIFSEREYRDALAEAGFCILERLAEAEFRMGAFVCQRQ